MSQEVDVITTRSYGPITVDLRRCDNCGSKGRPPLPMWLRVERDVTEFGLPPMPWDFCDTPCAVEFMAKLTGRMSH